jgi:copper chaperone CopZ
VLAVAALAAAAACQRAPESRVKAIDARIDGITCPTCVPPLRTSLTREYGASTIEVDDDTDAARVTFAGADQFSPAGFNAAVQRVRMRVVTVRMQACGTLETKDGTAWLTAGSNRFRVLSERALPSAGAICADGSLDVHTDPATFQVSAFSTQGS